MKNINLPKLDVAVSGWLDRDAAYHNISRDSDRNIIYEAYYYVLTPPCDVCRIEQVKKLMPKIGTERNPISLGLYFHDGTIEEVSRQNPRNGRMYVRGTIDGTRLIINGETVDISGIRAIKFIFQPQK